MEYSRAGQILLVSQILRHAIVALERSAKEEVEKEQVRAEHRHNETKHEEAIDHVLVEIGLRGIKRVPEVEYFAPLVFVEELVAEEDVAYVVALGRLAIQRVENLEGIAEC